MYPAGPQPSGLGIIEDVQDDYQDHLTGLESRRALRLDAALLKDMTLVLLDVDGFKGINDAHGHAAGDTLLVALAELLRASAQTWGARAYRLGGDEFVVLGAGPLDAGQMKEVQVQFRRSAAQSGLEVQGFSSGLSRAPRDGQSLCELLERADVRLMRQKADRRGAMAAQFLRHFRQPEMEARPAVHDPRTERSSQTGRTGAPLPHSMEAKTR